MKFSNAASSFLLSSFILNSVSPQTIVDVVVGSEIHTTLEAAVLAAPAVIAETLSNPDLNLTLFAPDDTAFAAISQDFLAQLITPTWTNHLVCLLTNHVLTSRVPSSAIEGRLEVEAFGGATITVEKKDGGIQDGLVFVDGVQVTAPDIEASNGIIHSISARPILPDCVTGSIVTELTSAPLSFQVLVDLASKAGLVDTLSNGSPLTLFAPNNLAFAKLDKHVLDFLNDDMDALVKVLTYHVVPTNLYLEVDEVVTTVESGELTITGTMEAEDDDVDLEVNGIRIYETNLVGNGVVHRISTVLIPPDLVIPEPEPCSGFGCDFGFGGGFVCFSGSTTVDVQNKGQTKMSDLQIGDNIAVDGQTYEPIYSFGHRAPSAKSDNFVEIKTTAGNNVQVSKEHLLFVEDGKTVAAGSIQKGDRLANDVIVQSVKSVSINDGLYAPFTPSGKYVVNGDILASSFISFDNDSQVNVGGINFSNQWMSHSFEFPHRVVCHYLGQCKNETYDADGLSEGWGNYPLAFITQVFGLGTVAKTLVFSTMIVVFAAFNIIETTFFAYPVVGFVAAIMAMAMMKKNKNKNIL